MALFKVLVAAATIATALAVPHGHGKGGSEANHNTHHNTHHNHKLHKTVGDYANQCGNHQKLHCCNKGDSVGALNDILSGSCSPIDLSVIAITVPISTACTNQVACCSGAQPGLIPLQCNNINL
ncbi:hydrophobin [Metarhizium album ARSEF 1941]|uniref:Hydrophobin n=1 Tax=Metarhizium album (strain ARSEF 1941) TaxID=1081103 RepID=A0A0B2X792_METAS|nr:hydrophobin [Metarhizium album ARSEF 1941]KHO01350.1 hydrophobin [Metarhizium album ARSEF 1941]